MCLATGIGIVPRLAASLCKLSLNTDLMMTDSEVQAIAQRTPLISVTRVVPDIDSVCTDDVAGGKLATSHLIESGHTQIVFLSNPQTEGYQGRQQGYVSAMQKAGLEPRIVPVTYDRHDAESAAGQILDAPQPPTAFFAHNDQTALGVLDAIVLRAPFRSRGTREFYQVRIGADTRSDADNLDRHAMKDRIARRTADRQAHQTERGQVLQAGLQASDAAGDEHPEWTANCSERGHHQFHGDARCKIVATREAKERTPQKQGRNNPVSDQQKTQQTDESRQK
mgnify:CR=1 FL=1